jgi:hypothetical protein
VRSSASLEESTGGQAVSATSEKPVRDTTFYR